MIIATQHDADVGAVASMPPDRITELMSAAKACQQRGEGDKALDMLAEALELVDKHDLDWRRADILRHIGSLHRERGDTDKAQHFYVESLAAAERLGYRTGIAHALNLVAVIEVRRGDLVTAEKDFKQASEIAVEVKEFRLVGMVEQNLGVLANIRGDTASALLRYQTALGAFRKEGDHDMIASVLNNIGLLETELRHWPEADAAFSEGGQIARMTGNAATMNSIELNRAELAAAQQRWKTVEQISRVARDLARQRNDRVGEAEALRLSGMAARETGSPEEAERSLLQANALASEADDKLLQAQVARELGVLFARTQRSAEARASLMRSLDLFDKIGAALEKADVEDRIKHLCHA